MVARDQKLKSDSSLRLLILSHDYATFTKDQVEELAPFVREIVVLVRYATIANLYKLLPFHFLAPFTKKARIDLRDVPSNVRVIPVPLFYIPIDLFYKYLGSCHLRTVERIIKRERIQFDLIHAHFSWTAGYVGAKLKSKYMVPLVLTVHGYDIYDLPFRNADWQRKITGVLQQADHIITVSQRNLDYLKELNIQRPMSIIHNGYRGKDFHLMDSRLCRERIGLPIHKRIVLSVGNLVEIKGHEYLIRAISELKKSLNDVYFVIVGDGKLRGKLEALAQQLGVQDKIMWAGARPHSEIPIWMNACDLFVLPSIREGFSLVHVEAMACGKPVVATRNGGSEELINPGVGILVKPKNAQELAKGIQQALIHKWSADQIRKHSLELDWTRLCRKILAIYQNINPNRMF